MHTSINNFSEPNFRSQSVALIASSSWMRTATKSRCIRLLPLFISSDQFLAVKSLLRRPVWERDFVTHFDHIFGISIWQSMDAKLYAIFLEPIVESIRDLLR